jgi:co-chaperonin GroES (HSP10)
METKLTPKEERYKKAYEALKKAFVEVKGMQNIKASCVAFNHTVIIKKVMGGQEQTTEGGLILAETSDVNSIKPNVGIIVAAGPECSELVIPGIKIAYNQFANLEVFIRGEFYHVIHEHDIHCALTSDTPVMMDTLSDKEKGSIKRAKGDVIANKVFKAREEEFKNKIELNIKKG